MNTNQEDNLGWGVKAEDGSEIWDAKPAFQHETITKKDWLRLLFFPKKFMTYRYIQKEFDAKAKEDRNLHTDPFRILDIGCGTGGSLIDFKRMFGRSCEVVGLDVFQMLIDIAKQKLREHGVHGDIEWYDGDQFPFSDETFDIVYASDVLGHVQDADAWLSEINRVLKPDGLVVMFSESALGKHAYIRKYLFDRGLNIDPHAEFHISLHSKQELKALFQKNNMPIDRMYTIFWASFFVHPDEFYDILQKQKKFPILRFINALLYRLKKWTHPVSTAACELYGFIEMITVGRWIEAQGYIIRGRKRS